MEDLSFIPHTATGAELEWAAAKCRRAFARMEEVKYRYTVGEATDEDLDRAEAAYEAAKTARVKVARVAGVCA